MTSRMALGSLLLAGLLLGSGGGGVTPVHGEAFFTEGEVKQSAAANNFGKTFMYYLLNYGLTVAGVGMVLGGLVRMKERPGQGWTGIGTGAVTGYVGEFVRGNHDPAAASTLGLPAVAGSSWELWVGSLLLQAALVALAVGALRRRAHVETQSERL